MTIKNDKVFEKLNDSALCNVTGGLEINKPLNTVVVGNDLNSKKDTNKNTNKNNDEKLSVPSTKLPNEPLDGLDDGLIR